MGYETAFAGVRQPCIQWRGTMADEKITEESVEVDEIEAPVSAICNNAEELAADLVDDDSEIKPVEGFFLTSQRWH